MPAVAGSNAAEDTDRFRKLYHLLAALSRASALEDVYDAALTSLLDATAADRAAILLFDVDGIIRFKAWRGLSDSYRAAVAGHSPWKAGTQNAKTLVVPDVLADEALAPYRDAFLNEGIRGLAFVPFGPKADELRLRIRANHRPAWAVMPTAEATLLWLRKNLPEQAEAIVSRARQHFQSQMEAACS